MAKPFIIKKAGVSPCKGCTRSMKEIGCHSKCKDYISWKENVTNYNKHVQEINHSEISNNTLCKKILKEDK